MLGRIPLTRRRLTVQPLADIGINPAVISVAFPVAVAVAALDSVKAFQRNNAFSNQRDGICGVARMVLVRDLPNNRLAVVKRSGVLYQRARGKRTQRLCHVSSLLVCFSPSESVLRTSSGLAR